jgi:hypothetical protein
MSEQRLPIHPYAELFPPMTLAEFEQLCDDIQQHGLQEDIVVHEGKVLEGRNRYLACLARGLEARFRPYAGECGSPLAFVVARNLHRRHLTESQRALVAARLKPLFEEEARQRQVASQIRGDVFPAVKNSSPPRESKEERRSVHKAAELMNVSRFSVQAADKVQKQGIEALTAAVAAGKISVSLAARIAVLTAEQQQGVIAGIESGLKSKQARARLHHATSGKGPAWADDDGRPLPKSLRPAFRGRQRLDQLCQRVDRVIRDVERLRDTPAAVHLDVGEVSGSLKAASQALAAARPSRLCPHQPDAGADCQSCRGHGWIPAGNRADGTAER